MCYLIYYGKKMNYPELFTPNAHSDYLIRWIEIVPERTVAIHEVLEKNYLLGKIIKVEQVGAMEVRSNNFRITFETKHGILRIILRKNIQWATLSELETVNNFLKAVRNFGVPTPEIITAKDGREIVESGSSFWQVFAYIPGNYYQGKEDELSAVASAVGILHKALAAIPEDARLKSSSWKLPTEADFKLIFEAAKNDASELGAMIRDNEQIIRDAIDNLLVHKSAIGKSLTQMIHADLHPHNFLFNQDRLTAILDFGDVRLGFRAADAASACHRLVRQYVVCSGKSWNKVLEKGLRTFISNYQTVFPLPAKELALFSEFMALALLRKIKGNLFKYFQKKPDWSYDVAHKEFIKQMNLFAEVETMKEILQKL